MYYNTNWGVRARACVDYDARIKSTANRTHINIYFIFSDDKYKGI